jgi:hypothetical protein
VVWGIWYGWEKELFIFPLILIFLFSFPFSLLDPLTLDYGLIGEWAVVLWFGGDELMPIRDEIHLFYSPYSHSHMYHTSEWKQSNRQLSAPALVGLR